MSPTSTSCCSRRKPSCWRCEPPVIPSDRQECESVTAFISSTTGIPEVRRVPRHVAVIMDGNGRWAKQRYLPRVAGHKKGAESVRTIVRACGERGVDYLTLFAFSSENWRRPAEEVSFLMQLFAGALREEVEKLHEN